MKYIYVTYVPFEWRNIKYITLSSFWFLFMYIRLYISIVQHLEQCCGLTLSQFPPDYRSFTVVIIVINVSIKWLKDIIFLPKFSIKIKLWSHMWHQSLIISLDLWRLCSPIHRAKSCFYTRMYVLVCMYACMYVMYTCMHVCSMSFPHEGFI
jgi:hypothetical protein